MDLGTPKKGKIDLFEEELNAENQEFERKNNARKDGGIGGEGFRSYFLGKKGGNDMFP
jgi:hypothetical protein